MKKILITIILTLTLTGLFAQNLTLKKLYVKDTVILTKGIKFLVDGSYMDIAGGDSGDTTFWNLPTYFGHKMINAKQSKLVNADSGYASHGKIWLKANKTAANGSYYIGDGTPGIGNAGTKNTIFGYLSGFSNTGSQNTFMGANSGVYNSNGEYNTFIGYNAGYNNTSGAYNVFLGSNAGYDNKVGSSNIFIGSLAGNGLNSSSHIWIGTNSNSLPFLYGHQGKDSAAFNSSLSILGNTYCNDTLFYKDGTYSVTVPAGGGGLSWSDTLTKLSTKSDDIKYWRMFNNGTGFSQYMQNVKEVMLIDLYNSDSVLYMTNDGAITDFIGNLTINGDSVLHFNDTSKAGAAGIVTKLHLENRIASIGGGSSKWIYPSGSSASGYILPDASKKIISTKFYTADSILHYDYTNTNLFINKSDNSLVTGQKNVLIGYRAGYGIAGGSNNVCIGENAYGGYIAGQTGSNNVSLGFYSLYNNTSGADNVAIGYGAGRDNTTGTNNIKIGAYAGMYLTTETGVMVVNPFDRTNKAGDSTKTLYARFTASGLSQMLYWGGGLYIKNNITTNGTYNYGEDAGSNDTYVASISYITAYTKGMQISFYANTANTGACTININSIGARDLKVFHDQDPPDDYIESGSIITAIYDGINFQIQTPDANP